MNKLVNTLINHELVLLVSDVNQLLFVELGYILANMINN